jgi:single-strand DNA-binding protein
MFQQLTIIGNVGGDAESRFTPGGQQVTSFSVATTRKWTGQDGQQNEKTVWFRITCWRKLAEITAEYVKRGDRVLVVGVLEEPHAYTDREGNLRAALEVTADTVRFLTSKAEREERGGGAPVQAGGPDKLDDDIPF